MNQNKPMQAGDILNYWHAVEIFSPQPAPPLRKHDNSVTAPQTNDDLDWHRKHPQPSTDRQHRLFRHRVFAGIFSQAFLGETIIKHFKHLDMHETERIALDNRQDGEFCLFCFDVDDSGVPFQESFFLSSTAWALCRLRAPGPEQDDWLEGFRQAEQQAATLFHNWCAPFSPPKNALLGIGEIRTLAQVMADTIGWAGVIEKQHYLEIRIQKIPRRREEGNERPDDPLNSFYLEDLIRVRNAVNRTRSSPPLQAYLNPAPASSRIDVDHDLGAVWTSLAPRSFPAGCWPAAIRHPLAHGQQLAVNEALNGLREGGILAVNGPPGTGKTTLLQDIVAAIVCERAQALASLDSPAALFELTPCIIDQPSWTHYVRPFTESFRNTGVVVASSNNGAVENISLELPDSAAVDQSWLGETDYFRELATDLLNPDRQKKNRNATARREAWGLLAARLGNSGNREQFVNDFWFSNQHESFRIYLEQKIARNKAGHSTTADWEKARAAFLDAVQKQRDLQNNINDIYETARQAQSLRDNIAEHEAESKRCHEDLDTARAQMHEARTSARNAELALLTAQSVADDHRNARPGWLRIVATLSRAWWSWREQDRIVQNHLRNAERSHKRAGLLLEEAQDNVILAERRFAGVKQALQQCRDTLDRCKAKIQAARLLGWQVPDMNGWLSDEAARESASPWHRPDWREARTRVFLRALDLHRAAVDCQPEIFKSNLNFLIDLLKGKVPDEPKYRTAARAAWDTLFFIIPVVSTTFASFARQFRHLQRGDIGWLLVDEAGQAIPQAAVGALWRSRRAVVVGDPFQLEPIGNLPFSVQRDLAGRYGVNDDWIPERISAQGVADRASPLGAWLADADGKSMWVGCPLRVHRRCDEPMFRIANEIAYAGKMVNGVMRTEDLDLPPSGWCHVPSDESDVKGHWIRQETDMAACLVNHLVNTARVPSREIFVISPFRDTVTAFGNYPILKGIQHGTIHTVQGKQAWVVILVLGGNPAKPGAKAWASEKPNLLNVAVTRACRRLYVIGDRDRWRQYPYFQVGDRYLDITRAEDFGCHGRSDGQSEATSGRSAIHTEEEATPPPAPQPGCRPAEP